MISQLDRVKYGTITIPYQIIKTGRIKTSEVIVDADTITVRAPFGKDKLEIQRLVLDKASWILKKQKEYKETIPEVAKPSFRENTTLPYLGADYPLRINKKQAEDSIDLVNGIFMVKTKSSTVTPSYIKKLYENWLTKKAQDIFGHKVKSHSKKLGLRVERTDIKNLKNRWGSLTKAGVVNLNLNLLKAPENVIDYIVLHELCHLKIKDHSHHYWDMLHEFMPNYHDKIEWLKVNGDNLLRTLQTK
jgi:predicted metal-dependent hydrolase